MSIPVPPSWKVRAQWPLLSSSSSRLLTLLLCSALAQDLGKSSNDLLSKDFPISGSNLEVKTKAPNNVVFKVTGARDKAGLINGSVFLCGLWLLPPLLYALLYE
jgi:Eukaryotic porin